LIEACKERDAALRVVDSLKNKLNETRTTFAAKNSRLERKLASCKADKNTLTTERNQSQNQNRELAKNNAELFQKLVIAEQHAKDITNANAELVGERNTLLVTLCGCGMDMQDMKEKLELKVMEEEEHESISDDSKHEDDDSYIYEDEDDDDNNDDDYSQQLVAEIDQLKRELHLARLNGSNSQSASVEVIMNTGTLLRLKQEKDQYQQDYDQVKEELLKMKESNTQLSEKVNNYEKLQQSHDISRMLKMSKDALDKNILITGKRLDQMRKVRDCYKYA
jgi:chromosome segregation ATPase